MMRPRAGWKEKFETMAENGDDKMIDENPGEQTEWDKEEWEW